MKRKVFPWVVASTDSQPLPIVTVLQLGCRQIAALEERLARGGRNKEVDPTDPKLADWAAAGHTLSDEAKAYASPEETSRLAKQRGLEARLLRLCQPFRECRSLLQSPAR